MMKTAILAVLLLTTLGCSHEAGDDPGPLPVPSVMPQTSIECRPCDKRGPDIQVDIPISTCDETALQLCWTIHLDRCWYGCVTTGDVGRQGCDH